MDRGGGGGGGVGVGGGVVGSNLLVGHLLSWAAPCSSLILHLPQSQMSSVALRWDIGKTTAAYYATLF